MSCLRIWEITRRPKFIVRDMNLPLTVVRADARKYDEEILPVVRNILENKVYGFLTPIELIMPTSHHTSIRVKDVIREYPILTQDNDVSEAFSKFREFKTIGAPVVDNLVDNRLIGVVTYNDLLNYLIKTGYRPLAETVEEVMTKKNLDKYIISWRDRANKVWSRIVYHGLPGVVAVRSLDEPIPMGIVTYKEFIRSSRWLFHRESEQHITAPAKVQRIMLRGVLVATNDMPIEMVAKVVAEQDLPLVPVIDSDGRVIGVLTYEDLIRAYLEGAKPGRAPVPIAKVIPAPVAREERITFVSRKRILEQVLVAKPIERPAYIGIRAEDIFVEELPAVSINDTVEHARKEMLKKRTDYLLVVDEHGEIIGVVTKWNMLHALGLKGPLWRRRVRDRFFIDFVMQSNIPRVHLDTPIEEIAFNMVKSESEVVFAVDERGEIIGFITKDHVIKASKDLLRDILVENIILPSKIASVNPFHSLYHVVNKMKTLYLDAITVFDGSNVLGVIATNRLPFIAFEDAKTGIKSRRLIWVRKLVRGAAKKGRYIKVTPLLAIDAMVPYRKYVPPDTIVTRALDIMEEAKLNGIPVLSMDREIVSIVSKNDVLRELSRRAKRLAKIEIEKVKRTEKKMKAK